MSCIYQVCLVQSFEGELCFLIHFWLQHNFVLNDVIGMPHWITHKYIKPQFRYPLYIRGICHTYTAAVHIHGICMVYTDYIPRRGSRWSTYSGKIVRTRYVLGVKSTYLVCSSTYSYQSNSHFISGTITLAAVTSLLETQDAQEHILVVGKVCHRLDILNMGVLTKCTYWVCTWYEMLRTETY